MFSSRKKVLVTGAGGQTGTIVVRKLLEQGKFEARALVRNNDSKATLLENLGNLASHLETVIGDVTKPETLEKAFEGIHALIVCSSAKPQLLKSSLPGVIFTKIFTLGFVSKKPSFYYPEGGSPEEVDWVGQRNQFDVAKTKGTKHIILVSSMAGTKPDHFLNTQMENIVLWKRKAEAYLMSKSLDVPYTIIHPGGLLPHFGGASAKVEGGRRQLYVGVDDELMDDERKVSQIPREDVAEVCVQCLLCEACKGKAFDLGSGPEQEKDVPIDVGELIKSLNGKSCKYSLADAAFKPDMSHKRGNACGICSGQ